MLIGLLAIAGLLALYLTVSYNRMVSKEENVANTYNSLQAMYQRRFDLIPMLTDVVKASADYEQRTLVTLTQIRSSAAGIRTPATFENFTTMENQQAEFAHTFNRVLAVVEKYPEIQSQKNYLHLQAQIQGTESRIRVARGDFNEAIREYNTYVRTFPSSVTAKIFGFKSKDGFSAEAGADKRVEIKF